MLKRISLKFIIIEIFLIHVKIYLSKNIKTSEKKKIALQYLSQGQIYSGLNQKLVKIFNRKNGTGLIRASSVCNIVVLKLLTIKEYPKC